MVVDFDSATAKVSTSRLVAQTRIVASTFTGFQYDIAPDGRFLINTLTKDAAPLTVMTGWTARLQRRPTVRETGGFCSSLRRGQFVHHPPVPERILDQQ